MTGKRSATTGRRVLVAVAIATVLVGGVIVATVPRGEQEQAITAETTQDAVVHVTIVVEGEFSYDQLCILRKFSAACPLLSSLETGFELHDLLSLIVHVIAKIRPWRGQTKHRHNEIDQTPN